MKKLSISSVIDKNRLHSENPWLIGLSVRIYDHESNTFLDPIRIVNNNETVTVEGEVYQAANFKLEFNESSTGIPEFSVQISDINQMIMPYLQDYKGGVGSKVAVQVINYVDDTIEEETQVFINQTNASANGYTVSWVLGINNPLRQIVPKRKQYKNQCPWAFKSTECGYTGPDSTCDLTLDGINGCRSKKNSKNFGGFPSISVTNV